MAGPDPELTKRAQKALAKVATLATPETILRWYRELIAKKYDGSPKRTPGRPRDRRTDQRKPPALSRRTSAAFSAVTNCGPVGISSPWRGKTP